MTVENVERVLVVGAGVMGHGFAQVFALNNLQVCLVDRADELLEQARGWIRKNLEYMVELGELQRPQIESTLKLIQLDTDLPMRAKGVDYVLEAVSEDLELKKTVFRQLDEAASPEAVLATNTSSFDINEFGRVVRYPERVIGTHWFHPPQITPCVEIIPGDTTSQKTVDFTFAFMERIGKFPTLCKSAPGFIGNRIQFAMAAEALAIVEEGLATPQEVDSIVKSSFGFRLSAYGPFEICDQAGLDTYQAVFRYLYGKVNREQFKPPRLLDTHVAQGRFGLKTQKGFYEYGGDAAESLKQERDRKFYARLRLFQDEQK